MSAPTRTTDPATSHAAGASVTKEEILRLRALVLCVLEGGPKTDEELVDMFDVLGWKGTPSGIRTRRNELWKLGKIANTGETRKTRSGRAAIVWGLA